MKIILAVLGVVAVAAVANGSIMGMVNTMNHVHRIDWKFNTMNQNPMSVPYTISYPTTNTYLIVMKTYMTDGDFPTMCGAPEPAQWNVTLYEGNGQCNRQGDKISCVGTITIWDSSYKDFKLVLVNCEANGLKGVHYNIGERDEPIMTSGSSATPILSVLSLTGLMTYII